MREAKVGFMAGFGELWREHPLMTATAILVVLLAGGVVLPPLVHAIVAALQSASGGDEPPIRVKGGSIDLDVIDPNTLTSSLGRKRQELVPRQRAPEQRGYWVCRPECSGWMSGRRLRCAEAGLQIQPIRLPAAVTMSRSKQQVTRHVLMGPKTLGRPREEPSAILGRALVAGH